MTQRTWEDLVMAGLELGRVGDQCQWDWGEMADEVGDGSLRSYAERVEKIQYSQLMLAQITGVGVAVLLQSDCFF